MYYNLDMMPELKPLLTQHSRHIWKLTEHPNFENFKNKLRIYILNVLGKD